MGVIERPSPNAAASGVTALSHLLPKLYAAQPSTSAFSAITADAPAVGTVIRPAVASAAAALAPISYSLSTALPAQYPVRTFITPAAANITQHTKNNILQGKDVNLAGLLLPSPAVERKWVDCSDVSVLLKTTDPRITHNLSFGEFVITFSIYRDILCQAYPERRVELDAYLAIIAELYQRYGGTVL
ncbi:hypothetical protein N1851_026915 [Merluccius polli]|uniref:Uncharacterized protein n=1 Tax=Merluccius polli TaxID=89951 RepID=A0AA47NTT6_MERPO|nr:hypothetical protein N1851_026915 [Merluccius polli]